MTLTRETRLPVALDVLFNEVDGEVVLLKQETGVYFGLNEIGTRVWIQLLKGTSLGEICDTLVDDYEVDADVLWQDLVTLVTQLDREGLVTGHVE